MAEAISAAEMKGVAEEMACDRFSDEGWVRTSARVPLEKELTVYVNLRELVTILCTPTKVNFLVLGFLYSEGIISGTSDVLMMRVCDEESEVDVRLSNPELELPTRRRLTSGCGGGAAFAIQGQRVDSDLVAMPVEVSSLMKQFQGQLDHIGLSAACTPRPWPIRRRCLSWLSILDDITPWTRSRASVC